jgi:hypothetical protein
MPDGEEHYSASRHAADVAVGRDGFLFHRLYNAFEQLCSDNVPTDRELAEWVSAFETNTAWCAAKGVRYLAVIVPERHVIYADKLVSDGAISSSRPVMRLLEAIDPSMRNGIVYMEPVLREARARADVFFKTDEHMNLHGTYLCYRAILDHLNPVVALAPLSEDALAVKRRRVSGHLGMRLDDEPLEDLESWQPVPDGGAVCVFRNRGGQGSVEVFEHEDERRPRAILFGDSNLSEIRHLLVTHFSRTVIIEHCHRLFFDLVRSEKPDVILHLMSETRLGWFHDLVPAGDFLRHCGEPVPAGRALLAIDFSRNGNGERFVGEGWSFAENSHTWMTGARSTLVLPTDVVGKIADQADEVLLDVTLWPLLHRPQRPSQRLTIGYQVGTETVDLGHFRMEQETRLEIPLPTRFLPAGPDACLTFDHPDAFALTEFGERETRILSFGISRLSLVVRSAARARGTGSTGRF